MIDLHIHSTCSDGTFTPKEIVHKVCLLYTSDAADEL